MSETFDYLAYRIFNTRGCHYVDTWNIYDCNPGSQPASQQASFIHYTTKQWFQLSDKRLFILP